MDKVYVIYYKDKMYKTNNRKTAYLEERYAKQVISAEVKTIAENDYDGYWYELDEKSKRLMVDEIRKKFEIREFIEDKSKKKYKIGRSENKN